MGGGKLLDLDWTERADCECQRAQLLEERRKNGGCYATLLMMET